MRHRIGAYRSEFFGRFREVLSDRRDFTIIGDRFLFQSELLFASRSDELGPEGHYLQVKFARILQEVMAEIPQDLSWILQVDGHTDARPIQTARFPSNWELSTARDPGGELPHRPRHPARAAQRHRLRRVPAP